MTRKGFAPIIILLIVAGILAVSATGYYLLPKNRLPQTTSPVATSTVTQPLAPTPSVSSLTASSSDIVSPTSTSPITEASSTLSLDVVGTSLDGKALKYGANTVDVITFTVLPIYSIGQTYNNQSQIREGDGYIDYHLYQSWYRFEDFKFINHDSQLEIYKGTDFVAGAPGQSLEYGQISVKTFSYDDRDYFVFGSVVNCGNGGCEDRYTLYSYGNGTSAAPFKLWENSWGWGHGGEKPYGTEHGGDLNFAIAYNGNIFLFPKAQPIVELDGDGKALHSFNLGSSTIADVLRNSATSRQFTFNNVPGACNYNARGTITLKNNQNPEDIVIPSTDLTWYGGQIAFTVANDIPAGTYQVEIRGYEVETGFCSRVNAGNITVPPVAPGAAIFPLRSTTQVGSFTLKTYCNSGNTIDHIDILNGNTTVQTISHVGIGPMPGSRSCPRPETVNANFDEYPDFKVFLWAGATGNAGYGIWLFNASAQQFDGGGDFSNPSFDAESKTVHTYTNNGCAGMCRTEDTFQVVNGKFVLFQEIITDDVDGKNIIQTIKQLKDGKMVVVSTSTQPINP